MEMGMFMKNIKRKIITILALVGIVGSTLVPSSSKAYVVDDVVSVKTINTDVCVATTENSLYDVEAVRNAMDMNSDAAGASARVNTTIIDATDLSNWYVYDHYNARCYTGQNQSERKQNWLSTTNYNEVLRPYFEESSRADNYYSQYGVTGIGGAPTSIQDLVEKNKNGVSETYPWGYAYDLKEHIAATSEGGKASMNFYGYPTSPFSDFLFYPAPNEGTKKVHYTVDARNVKTHSLNSAGFLFNTKVYEKDGNDVLSGYILLFQYRDNGTNSQNTIASGMQKAFLYKLTDINVASMHAGQNRNNDKLTSFGGEQVASIDLSNVNQYPFDGQYDVSDIEMEIDSNHVKVSMKKAGRNVINASSVQPVTIFDQDIDATGYGGFGPLVSYQSHSCPYTSSYQFSNLQMSISTTKSVLDGLSSADYIDKGVDEAEKELVDSSKYFILIGNNQQGQQGYLDYFSLQNDAVLLEKLKKQEIVLITNLNIQPPDEQINGTNYRLADYLGEDNVIQIPDDTLANMAANIKRIVGEKSYNKAQAEASQDALQNVIAVGQKAAACQVLYKDYQVESVDLNKISSAGLELKINPVVEIGVTNPKYKITKPDGSVAEYSTNRFKVFANGAWPAGKYTATVTYSENLAAHTTFYLVNLYDSYLNGEPTSLGGEMDGVQARLGDVGPKTVKGGVEYVAYFPKTDVNEIPNIDYVGVDVNGNGTIESSEKLTAQNYTYTRTSTEGILRVPGEKATADIYIFASQTYTTYPVKWHFLQPAKWEKLDYSYQNKVVRSTDLELNGKVLWEDCRDYYGSPSFKVTVAGNELTESQYIYNPATSEFHLPKVQINGPVEIYVDRPFLGADVEVETKNIEYSGPNKTDGNSDLEAVLTPNPGYKLPDKIQMQHKVQNTILQEGQTREYENYTESSYRYNKTTGEVKLSNSKMDGEVKIIAEGVLCHYYVTTNLHGLTFEGDAKGDVEHEYIGCLSAAEHYLLPAEIEVDRGDTPMTSGYSYNPTTGEIVISKGEIYDTISIKAVGEPCVYPITTTLQNVTFSGKESGDIEHAYRAKVHVDSHYELPESILVKRNGQEMTSGYTYQVADQSITLDKGEVTGPIEIIITANPVDYDVRTELKNLTFEGAKKGNVATEYQGKIMADAHYLLPENIQVTCDGTLMTSGYQYNPQTGEFRVEKGKLTGELVVQGTGIPILYEVTGTMKKATWEGATQGDIAHEYKGKITPAACYKLPKNIIVKCGNDILTSGYQYDSSSGIVTIEKGQIKDDIEVIAASDLIDYFVLYHTKYLSYEGVNIGDVEHEYQGKILVNDEYELPKEISIKRGDSILNSGYKYDANTGIFVIEKGQITEDVEVNAVGVERQYRVEAKVVKGDFVGEKIAYATQNYEGQIIAKKGYSNPEKIEVLVNGQLALDGVEYDYTSGEIRLLAPKIRGDILIKANMVASSSNVIFDVKNIVPEGNVNAITNDEYVAKLAPIAINYILPEAVNIKVGDKELVADQDYVYNSKTGVLAILKDVIDDTVTITAEAQKIVLKEEEKIPQEAPKEEDLSIVPPTYENTKDGKIIGVTRDMEYSLDGGTTWIACNANKILNLGVGTVMLRLKGDETKQVGAIASITLDSATSEYYIPTISMSKKIGCGKKFQIMLLNTSDAIVKTESTDTKIATVNSKGLVKAKKKVGKTKIVVTILKGSHIVQYVMNLTVAKDVKKNYSLSRFNTSCKSPSIALYKLVYRGAKWKIKMTHTKGSKITYHSSNKKVAKVDNKGNVIGISNGVATIRVSVENSKVSDHYYVYVRVAGKGEKVKIPSYLKIIK